MNKSLNVLVFPAQAIAPPGTSEDVQLLASVHPVLPPLQTSVWGSGADTEITAAGPDITVAPTVSAPLPAPASISVPTTVQVESQAPVPTPALLRAQNQAGTSAAMLQTPPSTLLTAPASIPVQAPSAAQIQAPVSASGPGLEQTKVSSVGSDTPSAMGKPHLSVQSLASGLIPVSLPAPLHPAAPAPAPVAVSVPAPVLQPAGIQTTVPVPECASLATTQQNLETTSASSTLQQEPCLEVGVKPSLKGNMSMVTFISTHNQIHTVCFSNHTHISCVLSSSLFNLL